MNGEPTTGETRVVEPDPPASPSPKAPAGTETDDDKSFWEKLGEKLPAVVIPAGVTVVTAAIALLGIQGDALTRLLRNYPTQLGWAITATLFGTVALFFIPKIKREKLRNVLLICATLAVVGGVLLAVWFAIIAVGERETPTIAFNVGDLDAAGDVPVEVTATGLSLRTADKMLLRVQGFGDSFTVREVHEACNSTVDLYAPEHPDVDVLYLAESGPVATGATTSKIELTVDPDDYRWLCAVAVLSKRPTTEEREEQQSNPPVPPSAPPTTSDPAPPSAPPTTSDPAPPSAPPTTSDTPATQSPAEERRGADERFLSALLDLQAVPTRSPTPTPTTP